MIGTRKPARFLAARWETIYPEQALVMLPSGRVTGRELDSSGVFVGFAAQRLRWWWPFRGIAVHTQGMAAYR